MKLVYELIKKFFEDKKSITFIIIILSITISLFKINIISYVTANIIQSLKNKNEKDSYTYLYYFIIVSAVYTLLFSLYKFLRSKILVDLKHWFRNEIIKKLLILNNNNFSESNFTKLNSPLIRLSNYIYYTLNSILTTILPNITVLLVIFVFFVYKNIYIGAIFLTGNIIVILYILYYLNDIVDVSKKYELEIKNSESYIVEILNNFDKIIFRGNKDKEIDKFANITNRTFDAGFSSHKYINYHVTIVSIIIFVMIFLIIFYMIYLYYNDNISSTILITFLTMLLLYKDTIINTVNHSTDIVDFYSNIKIFVDIFSKVINKDNIIEEGSINKLNFNNIRFENINFIYNDVNIFNNFNLDINTSTNKIIGITGISGVGKSTLMKLLINMYQYEGNIYIDGINTKKIDTNYIRKNIIYVNQNAKLFDDYIIENIFYGCEGKEYNSSRKHLEVIMSYKKIRELYKDIDLNNKKVGISGENISGGQRQVINIINGLIVPSKIVILDEPTNALDHELKKEIIEIIKYFKIYKNAIIIITHDKDIFPIFEERIKLDN
jgi:ABC-type bacteriocin/lantibiotic exporter with double-glycine peptidase domain